MMIFARVVQIAIAATGFTCSTAANKVKYDLYSQILSVYESPIKVSSFFFFLVVFTSECAEIFCLKRLLLRTLDVNIAKLCNI